MTTPNDDERTVSKGVMPSSGRDRAFNEPANALPAGTRLAEFEVISVIGEGGFGIVYLAYDHSLSRQVAIKEYMPAELASRTQHLTVSVRSERHAETFAAGLRSFINEARLLAQFDHPSLLKVYRFWEAHSTAYMVMPYYAGVTLGRTLKQRSRAPDEAWLRALMHHLLNALEQMHEANCYHRDISPDNILIQPDGRPLLLDFGAARRVIGDMQRALTVILKTGYAPVEQYGEMPDMKQGAWTDLYALASVVHHAITGQTPPPAVQRFLSDKYVPLVQLAATRYSLPFLQAIDRALAVLPQNRPQTVAEMRALLAQQPPEPAPGQTISRPAAAAPEAPRTQAPEHSVSWPPSAPATSWRTGREPSLGATQHSLPFPAASRTLGGVGTLSGISTFGGTGTLGGATTTGTVAAPADFTVVPTRAPTAAPRPAPMSDNGVGEHRRKLALAGAAVAGVIAASVGLVYLLVEYTAPENTATIHYRTNGSDTTNGSSVDAAVAPATEGASSPTSLAQSQAPAPPPPAQEALSSSGTSSPPMDDPAPSEPLAATPAAPPEVAPTAAPTPAEPEVRMATAPRATRGAANATGNDKRTISSTSGSTIKPTASRRCIDIIQRVSLGEPLTPEERDILKQECGQ